MATWRLTCAPVLAALLGACGTSLANVASVSLDLTTEVRLLQVIHP